RGIVKSGLPREQRKCAPARTWTRQPSAFLLRDGGLAPGLREFPNPSRGDPFMRNLLAFLGAVVVTVLGVGWYLDWFKVHRGAVGDGKSNYNIELNTKKIDEDLHKGSAKLHGMVENKLHGSAELTPPP